MADSKLSELGAATELDSDDLLYAVEDGVSVKATISEVVAASDLADQVSFLQGASDYAVLSTTAVESDSESVTLDGTGFSEFDMNLPMYGFGETYTPAGISFNAVRIKAISRTPGATSKWRKLTVIVKTGATPRLGASDLVAIGDALVNPDLDVQTDVTVVLKDPVTGAVKTVSDASFSGGHYFIGVFAKNSDGDAASCGYPIGTMANSTLQSQYIYIDSPEPWTSTWANTSAGANRRVGFQHLLLTNPSESTAYAATEELSDSVFEKVAIPSRPEVVIPPAIYGVEGRECNVYLDNLHLSDADDYLHDVEAAGGLQQNERFTWTPGAAMTAGTLSISVHDKRTGTQLTSVSADQRAAAASAGTGITKKAVIIGDSLVGSGHITDTLVSIATTDVMGVQLIGTLGTGENLHEGRGGWTIARYNSDYVGNPFWIGGQFNFAQYLTDNVFDTPDWVFIHLGINDVFSRTTDSGAASQAQASFAHLDTIIASIKAADSGINVGLMVPSPPSADQDSFGANYTVGQTRWRFKRSILIWARELITHYSDQEASRIYLVPSNTALDTVNNMSRAAAAPVNSRSAVTVERQNNGVHPATDGYQQIGDALWAFLKYYA